MPQPTYHLYLADAALPLLPLPLQPDVHAAFLHGAIAPDVGFFPGGQYMWSHVGHHWRTADMCRTLLSSATNDVERAFAWGWTTHILADALLHPVINQWCRLQLGGDSQRDDLMRLHVQLELGIDVMHVNHLRRAGMPRFRSIFDETSIAFLTKAYLHTYAMRIGPRQLLSAHRNLEQLCRRLFDLEVVMAGASVSAYAAAPAKVVLQTLRTAAAVSCGRRSIVTGFLYPVFPSLDLGLALKDAADAFLPWFTQCVSSEMRYLPNIDLDTGRVIGDHVSFAVA